MAPYDYTVIGGGIGGLATAWHVLKRFPGARLLVLEKESGPAQHQTGRNSGVIHSGIYYNAPSPVATASLEIGREIARQVPDVTAKAMALSA